MVEDGAAHGRAGDAHDQDAVIVLNGALGISTALAQAPSHGVAAGAVRPEAGRA
jgi:hypothetical protein